MRALSILSFLFIVLFCTVMVQANDAAYQAGLTALKNGELNKALTSFQQVARKNPKNTEYAQEFMLLRQVIAMQSQLDKETTP